MRKVGWGWREWEQAKNKASEIPLFLKNKEINAAQIEGLPAAGCTCTATSSRRATHPVPAHARSYR